MKFTGRTRNGWASVGAVALALTLGVVVGASLVGCSTPEAETETEVESGEPAAGAGEITVTDPWVRAAAAEGNTAAYMVIANGTDSDDRLTGAVTGIASMTQVHETQREGDLMKMVHLVIMLAPLGVFCLLAWTVSRIGVGVFLGAMAKYMSTVLVGLGVHAFIVLPLLLWLFTRTNPLKFVSQMREALLTAFGTSSSSATLPVTIECATERGGCSDKAAGFVLPLGATINMDGTALYEAVAVLFIAQLYHGFNLELSQQIIVAFTALLASIGAAGIPHAGLVMMVIILQAVGLPVEMQGIIIAVDRVLDMCRTSVNVWSDSCGCAVIARLEATRDGVPQPLPEESMDFTP